MEPRLSLKMAQRLVLTPTLQQAIKLLQYSRQELVQYVHQELLENPTLEETASADDAQTSIDVRSKLMVQLREDILEEVTRLFFERKRLLLDMETSVGDERPSIEKQLKVQELTAYIDALTGGQFSRNEDI